MLNVVVLNGGRGAAALIQSLLNKDELQVTSIVNAYDDGKSTGEIRHFFDMLGPSDIRKVQELMLPKNDKSYENYLKLFTHRFKIGCSRHEALEQIQGFIDKSKPDLVGSFITSDRIKDSLRLILSDFLRSLKTIEKLKSDNTEISNGISYLKNQILYKKEDEI